jgi:hypothetical protein
LDGGVEGRIIDGPHRPSHPVNYAAAARAASSTYRDPGIKLNFL